MPYRRLIAAVLHRACMDYANAFAALSKYPKGKAPPELEAAYLRLNIWFSERDYNSGRHRRLKFAWICDVLDMDPDVVQSRTRANWRKLASAAELRALVEDVTTRGKPDA